MRDQDEIAYRDKEIVLCIPKKFTPSFVIVKSKLALMGVLENDRSYRHKKA